MLTILDMIICLSFNIGGGILEVPATAMGECLLEGPVLIIESLHQDYFQEKTGEFDTSSLDVSRQRL